jgi:FAD/FMN-containing dehydrogenase
MRGAEIDERCEARVDAGAHWIDVTVPAAEHGLAGLAGTSPDVGIVGYTVGGRLGWLGRKFGLAANSVLAADLVKADGQGARERRARAGAFLGRARRRRQLRDRDRARVPPLPGR